MEKTKHGFEQPEPGETAHPSHIEVRFKMEVWNVNAPALDGDWYIFTLNDADDAELQVILDTVKKEVERRVTVAP